MVPLPKRWGVTAATAPGGDHSGRSQAEFPGPVWQTQVGFPGVVSADSDFQQRTQLMSFPDQEVRSRHL